MAKRRRKRSGASTVLFAGLFLAFGAALFTGMYFLYGKLGRTWRGVAEVRVLFTQIKVLQASAPVLYDGMEVGRVKDVRVVPANAETLQNMPPLTKRSLVNLPLSDRERADLDRTPDAEVDAKARKIIDGRKMILAVFDMLIDHDDKRLREDDAYSVASGSLGDSSIQIATGSGKAVEPRPGMTFLGVNSDLISDIGRNVNQIEEMMQSMGDIVGGDSKKGLIQAQLKNFEGFTENLDTQTASMGGKVKEVWDGIDTRADESEKNMNEITDKILAIFPEVDAGLEKTADGIESMHGSLGKSAQDAIAEMTNYRKLAKDEMQRWRTYSAEYRESTPAKMKDLRKSADAALAAADKFDEALTRMDAEMKLGAENARAAIGQQTDSAMSVQETAWQFKKDPGYFATKFKLEQLAQRHQDWRYDMSRAQYIELRRELAEIQDSMQVADPADRERARIIEENLSGSDAFFGVSRADFVPGETPVERVTAPPLPATPRKGKK